MELQERIFLGQAGQGIRSRHRARPQHQVLAGPVAQPTFRLQAQAQHCRAQPIGAQHRCRRAVAQGVKGLDLYIAHDLALAGQTPTVLALCRVQGIGLLVINLALAAHQTRMATARATTVGHSHTGLVQGIQQIAAGGDRPAAFADVQFRHERPRIKMCDHCNCFL